MSQSQLKDRKGEIGHGLEKSLSRPRCKRNLRAGGLKVIDLNRDPPEVTEVEEMLQNLEDKYRLLLENIRAAIAIIDEDIIIKWVNSEFEKLSGYLRKEIEGKKSLIEFVRQEELEKMSEYFRLIRQDPKSVPAQIEFRFVDRWGNPKDIRISETMIPGTKKSVVFLLDITEFKHAERAMKESEQRYRLLAENITDVIWTMDMDLRYTFVSPSVERLRGYSVQEVMNQGLEEVLTPSSLEVVKKVYEEEISAEPREERYPFSSRTLELELKCKNGSTIWTEVKMSFIRSPDGRPVEIIGITRDISRRKQILETLKESEERLHFLSSSLLKAQETERKRISMELHDELGQALIALKLGLSSIQTRLRRGQKDIKDECEYIKNRIDHIIENVRRLSQDLSPYLLENLGLTASLRWLIDDLTKYQRMNASLNIANVDRFISQEKQLNIYRIFQEALTNMRKHALATCISVVIKKENNRLFFLIEDNGKGFDMKKAMRRDVEERGLGLTTMEERVRMMGGSLEIQSEEGKGTKIKFTIPLEKERI